MGHVPKHPFVISPILIKPTCVTCRITEDDGECHSEVWRSTLDRPLTCNPDNLDRKFLIDCLADDYPVIADLIGSTASPHPGDIWHPIVTKGNDGAYYNAPNLRDPIRWIVWRTCSLRWMYRHYNPQRQQYDDLSLGDTIPSSPCLTVLAGMQDYVIETMPEIAIFPADPLITFADHLKIRNWTDVDAPEARDLCGHRIFDITRDGQGCYFDLTGYIHLAKCKIRNCGGVFEKYDIYAKIPSRAKSAR